MLSQMRQTSLNACLQAGLCPRIAHESARRAGLPISMAISMLFCGDIARFLQLQLQVCFCLCSFVADEKE